MVRAGRAVFLHSLRSVPSRRASPREEGARPIGSINRSDLTPKNVDWGQSTTLRGGQFMAACAHDGLEREFKFFKWLKGGVCTTCAPGSQEKSCDGQCESA